MKNQEVVMTQFQRFLATLSVEGEEDTEESRQESSTIFYNTFPLFF
jgi:hypothetical protein